MDLGSMDGDWGNGPVQQEKQQRFVKQCSLVDEGMKGGADPLLSQEPGSVLPSYASLMDTDVGHDFSEDKLMKSGNLYSLYLLNSDNSSQQLNGSEGLLDTSSSPSKDKKDNVDTDEEIDVETDGVKDPSPEKVVENGHYDALFEGMPFTELKGKEVGPCSYCNLWRTIRFMSYCGRFPFCSVYCTKKFAVYKRERGELSEKTPEDIKAIRKLKVPTLFENQKARPLFPSSQPPENDSKRPRVCTNGSVSMTEGVRAFDWPSYLESQNTEAAPVKCFHHAPLAKEWKANLIGALLEVQNRDSDDSKDCFWIARVIKVAGYKAKLRFEGYGMDSYNDFWIHLCKAESYPLNGAEKAGKQLKPPKDVRDKLGSDWREYTTRIAHSGSPTFSIEKDKLEKDLTSPFKTDTQLEVVYKRQVSSTCVATVKKVVADRIYVQYENCKDTSKDFWFHQTSPLIHPVGWSQRVHHPLIATAAYKAEALDKGRKKKGGPRDAAWDVFQLPKPIPEEQNFSVGMKLEAIDPLKLGSISVATVVQTLGDGYLMIAIDGCLHDVASWFCYHATSPALLPIGFCEYHQIDLVAPRGYEGKFDWDDYLKATNSIAAPVELFHQKKIDPSFRVGQKLEAVDLIESGFICAATIRKISGPLLRVHFDGWDRSYDQWLNCMSPDIYPVGWCEMVGYPLQPPRVHDPATLVLPTPILKNGKKHKSTSSLHSHEKRKRSLSGSTGCYEANESFSSMADAIYSFSDTEDHPPPKPPKVSKKDKSDKHSKKERKSALSKDKKSKTKGHSKSKHKDDHKSSLQKALLPLSTPPVGSAKTLTTKRLHVDVPTSYSSNSNGSFLESPLSMRLLPDSPMSSSLDSFTSLSNGGVKSLTSGMHLDPLQMSPLTSTPDSSFQSILAKASCSSLMSHSETTPATKERIKNGQVAQSGPTSSSSSMLHHPRDAEKLSHKFPYPSSKHDGGSKHKSKKSKKSKKVRDKDRSKKEKKMKKKDKEKRKKCEADKKTTALYDKKSPSDAKVSKLAALLSLPGQINFPDNKPIINGFLNISSSALPSAPQKPKISQPPDHDPFAFEPEQEIEENKLKQTVAPKISSAKHISQTLPSSIPPKPSHKKKTIANKLLANKAKRRSVSVPATYRSTSGADVISQECKDNSFSGGSLPFIGLKKEAVSTPSQSSPPQVLHGSSPVSVVSKHSQPSLQSSVNTPKTSAETSTPPAPTSAPALMELRKLPLNIHPRDAQQLLRTLQWQDPNLYRQFLNLSASSAPFVPSRSSLPSPQRKDQPCSEPTVPAPTLKQTPQPVPRLINPQRLSPGQGTNEMIMLQHAMSGRPSSNLLPKTEAAEQLPRLDPNEVISALSRDETKKERPMKRMDKHLGQNAPVVKQNMMPLKRQSPTFMIAKTITSPTEPLLLSQVSHPRASPLANTPALVSPGAISSSPRMISSPHAVPSPHAAPSPHTVLVPSQRMMTSQQFISGEVSQEHAPSIRPRSTQRAVRPHALPLGNCQSKQDPQLSQVIQKQSPLSAGAPGTPNIMHRLPPLETLLKSLNSPTNTISPTLGSDTPVTSLRGIQPAPFRPNRPRLARPHSFPDASAIPSVSLAFQATSTSPSFPTFSTSYMPPVANTVTSPMTTGSKPMSKKTQSSSVVNFPMLSRSNSTHSVPHKQTTPTFPSSPTNSQASCTTSFKLSNFQTSSGYQSSGNRSGSTSVTSSPSPPTSQSSVPRSNPPTPTESGPGCIVEEFTLQKMVRPEIGIMNPWKWGICEVIQFLMDAGERGCVETFSKQNIDGRKFMSLSKDQIAKLTGMKVAPSLKIYQQIVRLRSLFPTPD